MTTPDPLRAPSDLPPVPPLPVEPINPGALKPAPSSEPPPLEAA